MIRSACFGVLFFLEAFGAVRTLRAECFYVPLRVRKQAADLVFSGTVASVQVLPDGAAVTFDVDQVWKGRLRRRTVIYTQRPVPESPGYRRGQRYVVLAPNYALRDFVDQPHEPDMSSGACGWNVPYEGAERELPSLGRPHEPRS